MHVALWWGEEENEELQPEDVGMCSEQVNDMQKRERLPDFTKLHNYMCENTVLFYLLEKG